MQVRVEMTCLLAIMIQLETSSGFTSSAPQAWMEVLIFLPTDKETFMSGEKPI